ncbi:MAG: hypothetical protein ABIH85_08720 [Candidatus Omnitrophota bacterium]
MKTNSLSFPHPVLGVRDDVHGCHRVEFTIAFSNDVVNMEVNHTFYNAVLEKLIGEEKAVFCTQIICPKTVYREIKCGKDKKQIIQLEQNDLRGKVTVDFFVIAAENIDTYENDKAHPDYQGFKFSVNKGDVLSVGGSDSFVADKQWQSTKSVGSFMTIRCGNKTKGPMGIDLTSESGKIVITLSINDFKRFQIYGQNESYYPIYHSCIVFPALSYALTAMLSPEGKDQFEEYLWYQMLEERRQTDDKLKVLEWEPSGVAEIAQTILGLPIDRVFISMETISKTEEQE